MKGRDEGGEGVRNSKEEPGEKSDGKRGQEKRKE